MDLVVEGLSKSNNPVLLQRLATFQPKAIRKFLDVYGKLLEEERAARKRIERALRVLSEAARSAVEVESEEELLQRVCNTIVELGYSYAWIGYAEEGGEVRPVAKAGEGNYADEIEVRWDESELGKGPAGTAIKTGQPVVVRDIESDQRYLSSIALPIFLDGKVVGSLNVYAAEKDAFDEEEVDLLKKLAENLSAALSRIRLRKERERAENFIKVVMEGVGAGIVVVEDGRIVYVNREFERMSGYTSQEVVGEHIKNFLTKFTPERDKILRYYKLMQVDPASASASASVSASVPKQHDMKYFDRHGNVRYAMVAVSPIPNSKHVVVAFTDITELKKAEAEREEAEAEYRTIFDSSPVGIVVINPSMIITDCNNAFLKIVDRTREDVVGKALTELGILGEETPELVKAIYSGEPFELETSGEKFLQVYLL